MGVLRVGFPDAHHPPLVKYDTATGVFSGYAIEVLRLILPSLGHELEVVPLRGTAIGVGMGVPELLAGDIDMTLVASGLSFTWSDPRMANLSTTAPFYEADSSGVPPASLPGPSPPAGRDRGPRSLCGLFTHDSRCTFTLHLHPTHTGLVNRSTTAPDLFALFAPFTPQLWATLCGTVVITAVCVHRPSFLLCTFLRLPSPSLPPFLRYQQPLTLCCMHK